MVIGRILGLVAIGVCAQGASAQQPIASQMRCAEVQATVARFGPMRLNFTPTTYDVVGAHPAFCGRRNSEPVWVRSVDSGQCLVGYVCTTFSNR